MTFGGARANTRPMSMIDPKAAIAAGQETIRVEARALEQLAEALAGALREPFVEAARLLADTKGRVIVSGMGKSGHIARKIAATLASTGTPAFYVHPGEAGHGDLGMITDDDVVLALSNSGETDELLMLLPALKRKGNALVAMTGRADSTLAATADVHLDVSVPEEACPLHLAPTLEDDERRNAADTQPRRNAGVLVDIEFRDLGPPGELGGDLLERGREHPARAAPGRP